MERWFIWRLMCQKLKSDKTVRISINEKKIEDISSLRQGLIRDIDGTKTLIVWAEIKSEEAVEVTLN